MTACKTCRFFQSMGNQFGEGHCRRYPPTSGVMFAVKPGQHDDRGNEVTTGRHFWTAQFPVMNETAWCGEFKGARE